MLVQMNCRMSESAAQRLKDRARLAGKTIGGIIEALLDSNDSNPINDSNSSNDSSLSAINPPDYVGEMTFELSVLADRVASLESLEPRLNAIEAWLDGVRAEVEAAAAPDPVAVAVEPAAVPDPPVSRKKARSVRSRDGMLP